MPVGAPASERVAAERADGLATRAGEDALRKRALRHPEHVREFRPYLSVYLLTLLVLAPVWIVTQYESSPGRLEHLSSTSRYAGDWGPWLIWVALVGAVVVAIVGYRVYAERFDTRAEPEHEVERLKRRR